MLFMLRGGLRAGGPPSPALLICVRWGDIVVVPATGPSVSRIDLLNEKEMSGFLEKFVVFRLCCGARIAGRGEMRCGVADGQTQTVQRRSVYNKNTVYDEKRERRGAIRQTSKDVFDLL